MKFARRARRPCLLWSQADASHPRTPFTTDSGVLSCFRDEMPPAFLNTCELRSRFFISAKLMQAWLCSRLSKRLWKSRSPPIFYKGIAIAVPFFCLPSSQRIVSRRIPPVTVFNRALRLPPSLVKTSRFGYLFFRLSFLSLFRLSFSFRLSWKC